MSVAIGAEVIEKHICLDKIKTVDSQFSLKGSQIKNFCIDIYNAYNTIKDKKFTRSKDENENKFFRRSIYAASDIKKETR